MCELVSTRRTRLKEPVVAYKAVFKTSWGTYWSQWEPDARSHIFDGLGTLTKDIKSALWNEYMGKNARYPGLGPVEDDTGIGFFMWDTPEQAIYACSGSRAGHILKVEVEPQLVYKLRGQVLDGIGNYIPATGLVAKKIHVLQPGRAVFAWDRTPYVDWDTTRVGP